MEDHKSLSDQFRRTLVLMLVSREADLKIWRSTILLLVLGNRDIRDFTFYSSQSFVNFYTYPVNVDINANLLEFLCGSKR